MNICFPKDIANKGILLYAVSLISLSLIFSNYAIDFVWFALGFLEISLFFLLAPKLSRKWQICNPTIFAKKLFGTAFVLRAVWVFFSYFFYINLTGIPFEQDAADALYYYNESGWLSDVSIGQIWYYMITIQNSISDSGYLIYLALIQKIVGHNIIPVRLVKALLGAWTCLLLYKLTRRIINEQVGRLAGVVAMLMPNLIIYCGLHLKETEMLLLMVLFLERTDMLLRSKILNPWNIVLIFFLVVALFSFRTVMGAVALFSLFTALLFSPNRIIKKGRRIAMAIWMVIAVTVLAGGVIVTEAEELWNGRQVQQENKRHMQTLRGNQWAKYATGTVMAPMIFVLPFSTMVDTGQENQKVMHAGNFIRNFMGAFVLIALYDTILKRKNWREFSLVGAFVVSYLGIISTTGFANAERFLLPGLPLLVILWCYGLSVFDKKYYRFAKFWFIAVPLMEYAWAFFKLGSRGLL